MSRMLKPSQELQNRFDPTARHPLGRVVGGIVCPRLVATSGVIYNALHPLNLPVDIQNACAESLLTGSAL